MNSFGGLGFRVWGFGLYWGEEGSVSKDQSLLGILAAAPLSVGLNLQG